MFVKRYFAYFDKKTILFETGASFDEPVKPTRWARNDSIDESSMSVMRVLMIVIALSNRLAQVDESYRAFDESY